TGNDVYHWGKGEGNDVINDYDYYDSQNADHKDKLKMGADIDTDNLWFTRSGNSLKVQLIGSQDSVTVQNWYSGNAYKVESIETADATISSADIEALVQAMAVFDAPSGSGEVIPQNIQDHLQPVLAASWKPV
ncbi:MAG: hypothetical protein OIF55_00115, partial [Amphritea sp.]|nr:hypothetical protein [Amphritea sp.]